MARSSVIARFACASIAAMAIAIATRARAAEPRASSSVTAHPSGCGALPWSRDAWIDLLRVELAADGIRVAFSSAPPTPGAAPEVTVDPASCDAAADRATLVFSSGDARRVRVVALSDVPLAARARVLAIAMAQLVREGMALETLPPALPPPPKPDTALTIDVHVRVDPPPPAPHSRDPKAPSIVVFGVGEARTFASTSTGLFGGRAGMRVAIVPLLAFELDAGALVGVKSDLLGRVEETLPSAGASVLAMGGDARVAFGVGPRIEAGYAIFRGRSAAASIAESTAHAPVVFFALTAEVTAHIASSLHAFAALDAGTTLLSYGARADDREVAAFDGALLSLRLGFAWSPGDDGVARPMNAK